MVSIRTDKCRMPRPKTVHLSSLSVGSTRSAKFFCSSASRRSRMCRLVNKSPSRPRNGDVLMVNSNDMVGSSTAMRSMTSGFSRSLMVSPISKPSIPVMAHRSPLRTWSTFSLPKPSKTNNSLARAFRFPFAVHRA